MNNSANKSTSQEINILLHDIRSVHNVGAIFRTSDAIGVSKIYLSGYSPTPKDRFGKDREDFSKCALGSEKTIKWEQVNDHLELISKLKKEGFQIISIEQNDNSVDYKKVLDKLSDKVLIIFGNEISGVSKEVIEKSDIIAEIPMYGLKESLNISVSAGIILFKWFDRD